MELASLIDHHYHTLFMARYGKRLSAVQQQAMDAIRRCRTPAAGELRVRCAGCDQTQYQPLSCGNRNCPKCQNHEATQWPDRQRAKLLPVEYFMATFTLPAELRPLAWLYQREVYAILIACAVSTLKDFGLNPDKLGVDLAMTAILHTHTRSLDYHPHVHIVIPGAVSMRVVSNGKSSRENTFSTRSPWRASLGHAFWMRSMKPNCPSPLVCPRAG